MGKLWIWVSAKKSFNSPYIRIPKHILREIRDEGPNVYYIIMTDDKRKVEEIVRIVFDPDSYQDYKATNTSQIQS